MPKKKLKKNDDILLNIVLDASGSMGVVTDATIEGMNQLLSEQAAEEGDCYLSLTLFNTSFDVRYVAEDVREIPQFARNGPNHYSPGGGTALYDAVATTIHGVEKWQQNNPWFTGKVLTVIWTDGQENSSREYARGYGGLDRLNELIKGKTAEGWDFTFLGAGNDAWLTAQDFAVSIPAAHTHTINHVAADYSGTSQSLSSSVKTYRGAGATWAGSDSVQSTAGPNKPKESTEDKLSKPRSGSSTS